MTEEGGLVVDPYMGVASALCAAVMHKRRGAGRIPAPSSSRSPASGSRQHSTGTLKVRPMGKEVYKPTANTGVAKNPFVNGNGDKSLFD